MNEEKIVLLKSAEARELLQISESTLKRWRKEKIISFYKLGGTYYYDQDELITAIFND